MKEVVGNLWTYPADVRVITTNGSIKKNGEAVMGRGCAREAAKLKPWLPGTLGQLLANYGHHCYILDRGKEEPVLCSFPVKFELYEKAHLRLIEQSAKELVELANDQAWIDVWETVVLPRPGCGNGDLRWEDVKPIIEPILDDRFHVITFSRS